MCGILVNFNNAPLSEKDICNIQNRGPNYYRSVFLPKTNYTIELNHSLLNITSDKLEPQPLFNKDHNLYAVVNGEIYNYNELKTYYSSKGYYFQTNSDSELVLAAHVFKEDFSKFSGDFSFVLYDKNKDNLIICTDHNGTVPLYLTNHSPKDKLSKFIISSCIPTHSTLSKNKTTFSLITQYTPSDSSLYDNTSCFPRGSITKISLNNQCLVYSKEIKYKPYNVNKIDITKSNSPTTNILQLLNSSIEYRIPQNKVSETCCLLSGGLDSSLITSLASKKGIKKAFGVTFRGLHNDESKEALDVANFLNIDYIPINISLEDMWEQLPKALSISKTPAINAHLSAKYILSKRISKEGYKVVLTGEGSDELFLGYSHFIQDFYPNLSNNNAITAGIHTTQNIHPKLELFVSEIYNTSISELPSWVLAKLNKGLELLELTNISLNDIILFCKNNKFFSEFKQDTTSKNLSISSWNKYVLSNYIIHCLGDSVTACHAVETRYPFLDIHLTNYVQSLDNQLLVSDKIDKPLLRNLSKEFSLLPDTIINTPKQPFMTPHLSNLLKNITYMKSAKESILNSTSLNINESRLNSFLQKLSNKDYTTAVEDSIFMQLYTTALLEV